MVEPTPPMPDQPGREGMGERPVLFLDFDGVICSPRAYIAQEQRWHGNSAIRWADPVACDLVLRLLEKHVAWLVISSTWRDIPDRCRIVLDRARLSLFLHDDWRTGRDEKGYRGNEVREWLSSHGNPPYIILDDDTDFDEDQRPNLIVTDSHNGMMLDEFEAADRLLSALRTLDTSRETDRG